MVSKVMAICIAVMFAHGAFGVDAIMTSKAETVNYVAVSNWTDLEGNPLSVPPTNATDNATFETITEGSPAVQTVRLGTQSTNNRSYTLGSLVSDHRRTFQFTASDTDYSQHGAYRLQVGDMSGYAGYWKVGDALAGFTLLQGQSLSSLIPSLRPFVSVASGTSAAVDTLYGAGNIVLDQTGSLTVGPNAKPGEDLNFNVQDAATLTLAGGLDEASVGQTLAKAAFRLDASRADTYTTVEKDGYTWVSEWRDANGGVIKAQTDPYVNTDPGQYFFPRVNRPFVSAQTSPTDLPLVDFGARFGTKWAATQPTGCVLKLSKEISGIRGFIFVACGDAGLGYSTILGHSGAYDLVADQDRFIHPAGLLEARNGEFEVNAVRSLARTYNAATATNLTVVSDQFVGTAGARFDLLGSDRYYLSRSCGFRLGELLVFTNDLTRAERFAAVRYLRNKWQGNAADSLTDAGSIRLGKATSVLSVPAGHTVTVRAVDAVGKKLVKSGDGTLRLGALTPADATIEVAGGSVEFTQPANRPTTDKPADGAYIWLDARKGLTTGTFDTDTQYVSTWADCRDGSTVKATSFYTEPPRMPTVVENAIGSWPAVSFGSLTAKTHAWMQFPNWGAAKSAYAGFMVVKLNRTGSTGNFFGCHSQLDFMRSSATALLASTYPQADSSGATWTLNGRVVDPYANEGAVINQTADFFVLAFSGEAVVQVNGIAKDRFDPVYYTDNCGDITIAEMLVYNRKLSEQERRNTEAYLMNRWNLGTHPDLQDVQRIASLEVTDGSQSVTVGGDKDVVIDRMSGGDGMLVKTGLGAVTVSDFAGGRDMTVEAGTLNLTGAGILKNLLAEALWHFDAADLDSFTKTVVDNGDGTATTNVTKWVDVRRNGVYAETTYGKSAYPFVKAHPTLKGIEMPDGSVRTVLDFGRDRNVTSADSVGPDAAGMWIRQAQGAMVTDYNKLRESFTVYSDVSGGRVKAGQIVGNSDVTHYLRDGSALLLANYTSDYVKNGYIAVDGVEKAYSYKLPVDTFHVISFGTTGNTSGSMLCQDRNCNAGGSRIAEQVTFKRALSSEERALIEHYLMAKWFGDTSRPVSVALGKVSVADGATVTVAERDYAYVTPSVSGAGTVDFPSVEGLSVLDIDGLQTFSGKVSFADAVTVNVSAAFDTKTAGVIPLVRAADYGALDLSTWTLNVAVPHSNCTYALVFADGAICLKIEKKGMLLLVR